MIHYAKLYNLFYSIQFYSILFYSKLSFTILNYCPIGFLPSHILFLFFNAVFSVYCLWLECSLTQMNSSDSFQVRTLDLRFLTILSLKEYFYATYLRFFPFFVFCFLFSIFCFPLYLIFILILILVFIYSFFYFFSLFLFIFRNWRCSVKNKSKKRNP